MRRTIDELIALYDLEPTTRRDIYVEGTDDRDLFGWYLEQIKQTSRGVFCVNDVDVPAQRIEELGLNRGSNRDRVIALAVLIWQSIDRNHCKLSFVVDADLSKCFHKHCVPVGVLTTDFPATDCYLLNDELVDRFLYVHCRVPKDRAPQMRASLFDVCVFLYALRVVLASFPIFVRIVGVERLLRVNSGRLELDKGAVVRRTLSTCGRLADFELVEFAVEEVLKTIQSTGLSALHFSHGHDALQILGEAVHLQIADSGYRNESRVRRSLLMSLRPDMLNGFELFKRLEAA